MKNLKKINTTIKRVTKDIETLKKLGFNIDVKVSGSPKIEFKKWI